MKSLLLKKILYLFLFVTATSLISCGDDSDCNPPVIQLTEVGHENSKMAYAGQDFHLEADIVTENGVKSIEVVLRKTDDDSYVMSETYDDSKYAGVRNVEFHEHVFVPADMPEGEYLLRMTVTDMKGGNATAESMLTVSQMVLTDE